MSHAIAPDEEPTPDSLWEVLAYYIECLFRTHGTQLDIAEKNWLTRHAYFQLSSWLFRCEELLRRCLFIDALTRYAYVYECEASLEAVRRMLPNRGRPVRAPRDRAPYTFDPDHPETWRVSFNLSAHTARVAPPSTGSGRRMDASAQVESGRLPEPVEGRRFAPTEPYPVQPGWPLARRIEALYRASKDRVRQAKRMARWLARQDAEDNARAFERLTQPTRTRQQLKSRPGDFAVEDAANLAKHVYAEHKEKLRAQNAPTAPRDNSS